MDDPLSTGSGVSILVRRGLIRIGVCEYSSF